MMVKSGITTLIERIYTPESAEVDWLEGICEGAQRAFEGQLAVQAFTIQVTSDGTFKFGTFGGDATANAGAVEAHAMVTNLDDVRRFYFSGPVVSTNNILASSQNRELREQHRNIVSTRGGIDSLGAIGMNPDGRACVLGFVHTSKMVRGATRTSLARIAGHLASGYRLRQSSETRDALVSTSGEVMETSTSTAAIHRADLRRAALALDRAKRQERQDPEAALGHWRAMVEGKWSLVERFESDGRRILVACRNDLKTQPSLLLSVEERQVVSRLALCRPAKLVAYELGFSESKVSLLLTSALTKLGLRNRAELVELYAHLVGENQS